MYQIEETTYLFILLLIPLLVMLFVYTYFWKKRKQNEFGNYQLLQKLIPNFSATKNIIKFIIVIFALILIIFALANPRYGIKSEKIKNEGIDVVFAIDVSKSMLAEDIAPNRLEKSKQIINQIINGLNQDRIGIIAYAANAFPILPMTADYSMGKMYLENMDTDMISSQGTALQDAIEQASFFFNEENKGKILILISDGEDHGSTIDEAISFAKEKGIAIITVGVGTETGAKIPIKNNDELIDYKKDSDGEIVITKLNSSILKVIATETKGTYIEANNTKEVVNKIEKIISKTQKNKAEFTKISEYKSQFQWFLFFAFMLILLDFLLTESKTNWLQKINFFKSLKNE